MASSSERFLPPGVGRSAAHSAVPRRRRLSPGFRLSYSQLEGKVGNERGIGSEVQLNATVGRGWECQSSTQPQYERDGHQVIKTHRPLSASPLSMHEQAGPARWRVACISAIRSSCRAFAGGGYTPNDDGSAASATCGPGCACCCIRLTRTGGTLSVGIRGGHFLPASRLAPINTPAAVEPTRWPSASEP